MMITQSDKTFKEIKPIAVGILGATGYGAGELLRLLTQHPDVDVVSLSSRSAVGVPITDIHPHLNGFYELSCESEINLNALKKSKKAVIFSALPHGVSGSTLAEKIPSWKAEIPHLRCIDLSGDLRIKQPALHQKYYPHSPLLSEWREISVYGLTELISEKALQNATLIANPGCLATAAIISLMPLTHLLVEERIVLNLATGSSGSGREAKVTTHHPNRHGNFYAYKPLNHQHEGEILEMLQRFNPRPHALQIVPHSLPVVRGILCTTYLNLMKSYTVSDIKNIFEETYADKPFLRLLKTSCSELQNVVGSNFADISFTLRDRSLVVMVAIDNLMKGMAGQAIQNMNVMLGLPQKQGLWQPALRPV